jgi:hypothetical protein
LAENPSTAAVADEDWKEVEEGQQLDEVKEKNSLQFFRVQGSWFKKLVGSGSNEKRKKKTTGTPNL